MQCVGCDTNWRIVGFGVQSLPECPRIDKAIIAKP
jgi:hypothetical protein